MSNNSEADYHDLRSYEVVFGVKVNDGLFYT